MNFALYYEFAQPLYYIVGVPLSSILFEDVGAIEFVIIIIIIIIIIKLEQAARHSHIGSVFYCVDQK